MTRVCISYVCGGSEIMIGHVPDYVRLVRNYCVVSFSYIPLVLSLLLFLSFLIDPRITPQEGTGISNPCQRTSTSKDIIRSAIILVNGAGSSEVADLHAGRDRITSGVNYVQDEMCRTLNYVKSIRLHHRRRRN